MHGRAAGRDNGLIDSREIRDHFVSAWRIPPHIGRSLPAVDSCRACPAADGSGGRVHFDQGTTRLAQSLGCGAVAAAAGPRGATDPEQAGSRSAGGAHRSGAASWAFAFDATPTCAAGRSRSAGAARGFSRIPGCGAGWRNARRRSGPVHRDLAASRVARSISNKPCPSFIACSTSSLPEAVGL